MPIEIQLFIGFLLLLPFLPYLFGALKESGRLQVPRRRSSTFRQFPTFPTDDDE
jgi:hypothetical protein